MPSAGCTPHGCQRWFNMLRDTASDRSRIGIYAMGESRPDRRRRHSGGDDGANLPSRQGRPHRPLETDRDAVQRQGRGGVRRRHGRLGASRQRHPLRRPVVQVSPPARHLQPRIRGAERAAVGRSRSRPRSIRTIARPAIDAVERPRRCARRTTSPSLQFDIGAVNDALSPIFVAGFYYKTFMWPRSFWDRVYEPAIRAAAGLGRAPSTPDPDRYQHAHAHCDVLVVGAGPAGLAAALAASESGKRVILADEQAEMGGALLHELTSTIDGRVGMGLARGDAGEARVARATSRCCRARPPSATTTTTTGPGAAGDRPPGQPAPGPAARASMAGARGRGRAGDRRARAPARVRRQRPAGHHAGREPARVRQPLRRRAGTARA